MLSPHTEHIAIVIGIMYIVVAAAADDDDDGDDLTLFGDVRCCTVASGSSDKRIYLGEIE